MKTSTTILFIAIIGCWFCSCEPADTCGPFPQGYDWEKKNTLLTIPFYPDSLKMDTLRISVEASNFPSDSKILYSSAIDSFQITSDVVGSNYMTAGADTLWKPTFQYRWSENKLILSYNGDISIIKRKNSQDPQCTPPRTDYISITRLLIVVPKTISVVKVGPW